MRLSDQAEVQALAPPALSSARFARELSAVIAAIRAMDTPSRHPRQLTIGRFRVAIREGMITKIQALNRAVIVVRHG